MKVSQRSLRFLVSLFISFSMSVMAAPPVGWDAERILPHFSFPKDYSQSEQKAAEELRSEMVHSLKYWQSRGLPKPDDIDTMIYISSYDDLRLNDLLTTLNPGLRDVKEHVIAQYKHFANSDLYAILTTVEQQSHLPAHVLTGKFFDGYAQLRYGFNVPHFIEHVLNDSLLAEIRGGRETHPSDNAYYSGTPSIDLTDVLPLSYQGRARKQTAMILSMLADEEFEDKLLTDLLKESGIKPTTNRRVVVLPRTTGMTGNTSVSTLNDKSVLTHELGHHMVATLAEKTVAGGVPLAVNEAMADYLAASQSNNPLIGEFFAKVSERIAKRLESSNDPEVELEAYQMHKIAARGALRDLRESVSIDEVERKFSIGEAHIDGHPIRSFLWELRNSPLGAEKVDRVSLEAIKELAAMPMVLTDSAVEHIHLRGFFLHAKRVYLVKAQTNAMLRQIVQETGDNRFQEDEVAVLKARAKIAVSQYFEHEEESAKMMRVREIHNGESPWRQLVAADYIIPEYFRAYYRAAQVLNLPDVAQAALKEAGKLMNATAIAVKVQNGSGKDELAFFRKSEESKNTEAIAKLARLFEVRQRVAKRIFDIPDNTPKEKLPAMLKPLMEMYGQSLDRMITFERTGLVARLDDPQLHSAAIHAIAEKAMKNNNDERNDENEKYVAGPPAALASLRSNSHLRGGCLGAFSAMSSLR